MDLEGICIDVAKSASASIKPLLDWLVLKYPNVALSGWEVEIVWNWGDRQKFIVTGETLEEVRERAKEVARQSSFAVENSDKVEAYIEWSDGVTSVIKVPLGLDPMRQAEAIAKTIPYYIANPGLTIKRITFGKLLSIDEVVVGEKKALEEERVVKQFIGPKLEGYLTALMNRVRGMYYGKKTEVELAYEVLDPLLERFTDELTERLGLGKDWEALIVSICAEIWNQVMSGWGLLAGDLSTVNEDLEYTWHTTHDEKACKICRVLDGQVFRGKDIIQKFPFATTAKDPDRPMDVVGRVHPHCRCRLSPS